MSIKIVKTALAAALVGGLVAGAAQAYEAGDWVGRVGLWGVFPKSHNLGTPLGTIDVDDGYSLGLNITYMVSPNFGVEVIGATPFKHDIELSGAGKVASTYHLPPTVFLQYHFMPQHTVRPYVGVGVNHTFFWGEKTTGALTGAKLDLKSSWGPAGELGVDVDIAPKWFLNATLAYMDIDSKAKVNGATLGTVNIDPWVFGFNVGTRF